MCRQGIYEILERAKSDLELRRMQVLGLQLSTPLSPSPLAPYLPLFDPRLDAA